MSPTILKYDSIDYLNPGLCPGGSIFGPFGEASGENG